MKLVFRLDGIGFCICVASLAEVKECLIHWLDREKEDAGRGMLGHIPFRGELIPFHDLRRIFELDSRPLPERFTVLVLAAHRATFAAAVDEVVGIFPAAQLQPAELPALLRDPDRQPYRRLESWQGEPLIFCDEECLHRVTERGV